MLTQATLQDLHRRYLPLRDGKLADYIPELAKADPDAFALAAVDTAGQAFEAGDCAREFTLQSVSKPFVYGLALGDHGRDEVRRRVGVEPTGDAFNSIIELEEQSHRPYNPMINSGAIAVSSLVRGADPAAKLLRVREMFAAYCGHPVAVDEKVLASEQNTAHRNRAIAHLLRHFGVIESGIDAVLDLYFQQCSILMSTRDLALMAATLANGGVQPVTGQRVLEAQFVRDLLSLMFTCGMYDSSGEWAYTVGLPAKSGVSGGILAVVPGRLGIATYSPLLDRHGHSVRGMRAFAELSSTGGLSIFDRAPERASPQESPA
jgi:glutaminase